MSEKVRNGGVQMNIRSAVCVLFVASLGPSVAAAGVGDVGIAQHEPIWSVATKTRVEHAGAELTRSADGLCVKATTRGLPEGAYTVWWVIYNYPSQCNNPAPYTGAVCGVTDFANTAVRATAMWAEGKLVGPDGRADISACVNKGEITGEILDLGTKEGLLNPRGAEIQMIVHWHGPGHFDEPALLGEQLTHFLGACQDVGGVTPPDCKDMQQIVFPARSLGSQQ